MSLTAEPRRDRFGARRQKLVGNAGSLLLGIAILLLWEFASGRFIDELFFSRPTAIWSALIKIVSSPEGLLRHGPTTLIEASIGFVIGTVPAAISGLILGRSRLLSAWLRPYIVAFYSAPRLALAPLFIIWFGIDAPMKIAFTATIVFFPVFIAAFSGARDVAPELIDSIRLMKAGRLFILRHVIVPSTLVWIFTGLRQSVPLAVTGAVVGELIASNRGLGFLLLQAAGQFNTANLFAVLLILILVSLIAYELIGVVEHRLLGWKTARVGLDSVE